MFKIIKIDDIREIINKDFIMDVNKSNNKKIILKILYIGNV